MSLLAFVPQAIASFFTLERCFVEMRSFWFALHMNQECNFILSTRFLSYHEVFSLLVLGCSCAVRAARASTALAPTGLKPGERDEGASLAGRFGRVVAMEAEE